MKYYGGERNISGYHLMPLPTSKISKQRLDEVLKDIGTKCSIKFY